MRSVFCAIHLLDTAGRRTQAPLHPFSNHNIYYTCH